MRVIAGKARRLMIKTPAGRETRPTTDRIKETLFNMINERTFGSSFLDLYAGSGGIGIEALSRGARQCVFVENSREALRCIRENLEHTQLGENAVILQSDVLQAVDRLSKKEEFDIIYVDPPYRQGGERELLLSMRKGHILAKGGIIIWEAEKDADFSAADGLGYFLFKEKIYKTNKHIFLKYEENE